MPVSLNPSLTRRDHSWASWKEARSLKNGLHQCIKEAGTYLIWFYDGPEVHVTELPESGVDTTDFENNYLPTANAPLEPKAKDGRLTVRTSTANRGTNFKLRAVSFYTADLQRAPHSVNPNTGLPYGDVTLRIYKADGTEITLVEDQGLAVRTVVDFEPTYDYEIVGGFLDLPSELKDGTTDEWFISAIGVPDYPPEFYGSIDFISEVNLEAVTSSRVVSDGRAISFMPYQLGGAPHTNRLRFILKHPTGIKKRFQLYLEHYA